MPGTIQVSVMDFQGPPSTSSPSPFLKVTMGKREYQTSNKGEFSFPLTNFRDNLVVKLLDAEETEIANTGIQTMSIVQKVSWDETFFFDGGGFVQLKLQFVLSEEERTRIRLKREEAVKKKLENVPKLSENSVITPPSGGSITSSRQAETKEPDLGTRTVLTVGSRDIVKTQPRLLPNTDISRSKYGGEGSILEQKIPKPLDERERVFPAPTIERTEGHRLEDDQNINKLEIESLMPNVQPDQVKEDSSKLKSGAILGKDDDHADKSPPKSLMKRSRSSVWNLVTAFETGVAKDSKLSVKAPAVRSENKKCRKEDGPKDNDISESAKQSSGKHIDPLVEECLRPSTTETSTKTEESSDSAKISVGDLRNDMEKAAEKLENEPIGPVENESDSKAVEEPALLERPTSNEMPTTSGRMHTELSEPSYFSFAEEIQRDDTTKTNAQVASIAKLKSLECYEEELLISENSGMSTFPNNWKPLCVTAAGNRVVSLLGSGPPETRSHGEGEQVIANRASENEAQKGQERSRSIENPSSTGSPDNGCGGLLGQVIKIAIIVGFGVLVLITRQREPRKSKREADKLLLATCEFMDARNNREEQADKLTTFSGLPSIEN